MLGLEVHLELGVSDVEEGAGGGGGRGVLGHQLEDAGLLLRYKHSSLSPLILSLTHLNPH